VTVYQLDFTKCSLCGSCVEACRDGAIRFSRAYNLASLNKDDYVMDLFKRLEDEAATDGAKSEGRNPKPEGNPKVEIRNPNSEIQSPLARDGKQENAVGVQLPVSDAPHSTLHAPPLSPNTQPTPLSK
jgi:ferredoxin